MFSLIGWATHQVSLMRLPADTVCTDEFNIPLQYDACLKSVKVGLGIAEGS